MEKTTKEMKIIPIDELIPYVNNARTHSPEQINKLRASLREFGFINPVIIDKDKNIIAGHGRVMAAREEGIKEVPCVLVDYLTEAQKKAYILADNRMALDAGWDEEMLRVEIESLQGADFDVSLTGFSDDEIAHIFDEETEAKEDDFNVEEELQKPVFSKAGDLWQMGKHRVLCGDSTKQETYAQLMDGVKPNLVLTDPPYLVNLRSTSGKIRNDDLNDQEGYEFLKKAFTCFHDAMAADASIYVFYATMKARVFYDAFEDAGFKVGAGLIWKNPRPPLCAPTGSLTWNPLSSGGGKTENTTGTGTRNRKQSLSLTGSRTAKRTVSGTPPVSRCPCWPI